MVNTLEFGQDSQKLANHGQDLVGSLCSLQIPVYIPSVSGTQIFLSLAHKAPSLGFTFRELAQMRAA